MTSYTAKLVTEESFTFLTEARTVVLIMMNFVWCVFGRNFKSKKDLACKDYIQQPFPVSAIFNFHLRKWTAKPHLQKNQFTQPEILVLCNHSLTHQSMPLNSIPLVQSKYSILQMKTQLQSKICNNWMKWNSLSNAHADLNELPISNNSIKNSTSICIVSDHNSFNHLKPKKEKRYILEGETNYHKRMRKQREP